MTENLSTNFSRQEFSCGCGCGFANPDPALVTGLQLLRDAVKRPVIIQSGCRCAAHNTKVGGAKRSMHVLGKAADIRVEGVSAVKLYQLTKRIPQFRGFGVDVQRGFVHVDTRDVTAVWSYRNGKQVAFEV
jgi:uncharacterized protein YcbK (DUF882 family)